MSPVNITLFDADEDPTRSGGYGAEFSELQGQVSNYLSYMSSKTGLSSKDIPVVVTLPRELIEELYASNSNTGGVRIYLTKKSSDVNVQTDINFLAVPVEKVNDVFREVFPTKFRKAFEEVCPYGACPSGNTQIKENYTLIRQQ